MQDQQRKRAQRGGGWLYGATVAAGSALPSYSGLYGGVDSMLGQNGYAGGTGSLSGAQFGGSTDAGASMGDAGGGVGGAGGGSSTT